MIFSKGSLTIILYFISGSAVYGGFDQDGPVGPIGGPLGSVGPVTGSVGGSIGGSISGPIGGPLGGPIGRPPIQRPWQGSRCEEDSFRQVGRQRMQRRYVRRFTTAQSLAHCQRECIEARDFICRAFNYRYKINICENYFAYTIL